MSFKSFCYAIIFIIIGFSISFLMCIIGIKCLFAIALMACGYYLYKYLSGPESPLAITRSYLCYNSLSGYYHEDITGRRVAHIVSYYPVNSSSSCSVFKVNDICYKVVITIGQDTEIFTELNAYAAANRIKSILDPAFDCWYKTTLFGHYNLNEYIKEEALRTLYNKICKNKWFLHCIAEQ